MNARIPFVKWVELHFRIDYIKKKLIVFIWFPIGPNLMLVSTTDFYSMKMECVSYMSPVN